jgi:hypothetical protein
MGMRKKRTECRVPRASAKRAIARLGCGWNRFHFTQGQSSAGGWFTPARYCPENHT